jgi:hypothetical protein
MQIRRRFAFGVDFCGIICGHNFKVLHAMESEMRRGEYGNLLIDLQGSSHHTFANIFAEGDLPTSVFIG